MDDKSTEFQQKISEVQHQVNLTKTSVDTKDEPHFSFDVLRLYFGEDYKINDKIVIHQPTIGDFITYGESNIYNAITPFVSNPTTFRVQLWEMGIDWNKFQDFKLFFMLIKSLNYEYTKLIFDDIDFQSFELCYRPNTDSEDQHNWVLYSKKNDIEIDYNTYREMSQYIQFMFDITPKVERIKGKYAKQDTINEDKQKQALANQSKHTSNLLPMISFCLNHPGFKYRKEDLKTMGIVEFIDSVRRLQVYETTNALLKGMYSGFVDVKKLNKEEMNFMRDLNQSDSK